MSLVVQRTTANKRTVEIVEVEPLHTWPMLPNHHALSRCASASYGSAIIGGRVAVDVHSGIVLCCWCVPVIAH